MDTSELCWQHAEQVGQVWAPPRVPRGDTACSLFPHAEYFLARKGGLETVVSKRIDYRSRLASSLQTCT